MSDLRTRTHPAQRADARRTGARQTRGLAAWAGLLFLGGAADAEAAAQGGSPPAVAKDASAAQAANSPSPTPSSDPSGVQVYDQAFFAPYNVQTAEDMLRRLPGVPALLDAAGGAGQTQARGLGSGGDQILIDGKRMAAKNQVIQALRRIPAASVARIELIRGTSGKVEVLSEGLIVNLVLLSGARAARAAGAYEINLKFNDRGWRDWDGLLSYSSGIGRLAYVVGYERNVWSPLGQTPASGAQDWTDRTRSEQYYYPSGNLQEARPQRWTRDHHKEIYTATATYDFQRGDQLRLNALYQPFPVTETDTTAYSRYSDAGAVLGRGEEFHKRYMDRRNIELGGQYERRIGPGSASLILISTRQKADTDDFRNRTESTGAFTEVSRGDSRLRTGEDIARVAYTWPVFARQSLTLGGEVARNTLNQNLAVFFDLNRDGRLEPVDIPTARARVKEIRGEAFAIHNWRLTSALTVESSLSVETSTISTNYRFIPKRTYTFPKPRIDLRYKVTPRDQVRLKLERTVSQLDFVNFVPLYNVVDDRIDAGNPQLAPEKTWIYEAAFQHLLARDGGSLDVRAFYKDISDHIDRGPFSVAPSGQILSAPINIDSARLYGAEFKAALRLTALGVPGAQINSRLLVQQSRVADPFTGRGRKMKDPYGSEFNMAFRHDLTRWGASYGISLIDTNGAQLTSDIRNLEYYTRGPRVDLFVEKGLPANLSLRLEAYNVNGAREAKRRYLYATSQADGRLVRSERYEESRDRRFALRLRGKF